jgi:hypothetical protein
MFIRGSRWYVLTALAVGNLVLWVAIAGIIGLMVSDSVDLGFETLMRQGQATAVSVIEDVSRGVSAPAATRTPAQTSQPAAATEGLPVAQASAPAYRTPAPQPTATVYVPATSTPAPSPTEQTPSTAPPPPLVSTPLLLADPAISSLSSLDAEMDRSASNRPVQIRYTEETLNREVATLIQNNPEVPFRDVRLDMKPDGLVATGRVTVLGFQLNAEATGRVIVVDCAPQVEIDNVSVAGFMTPKFIKDQVEELLLDAMAWYPADYPLCLEQIVVEETEATIYGHRR